MTLVADSGPGIMLSSELEPRELIHLAGLAEDLGYRELWYTDQRFWRDCYAGLSLVAANTNRILLGPGVNDPFTRHPALIAMSIASLDEVSGGRAQLGLGSGGSGIAEMRLRKERPVRALQEAIEIVRAMMTGETVSYDGELFALDGAKLGFAPFRPDVPVFVATHSPQTLRLCGRLADGILLANMGTRSAIDTAIEFVRAGERAAGRSEGTTQIDLRLEAIISEDRDGAFAVLRARMARRLINSYPSWGFLGDYAASLKRETRDAAGRRDYDAVVTTLSDDDVRSTALVGSVDEAATQLAGLLTDGVHRVTIRPYAYGGQGQDVTIELFATEVWPRAVSHAQLR